MDNSTIDNDGCATHGNIGLGFGLATAAGLMTFVGAFTVFIPIKLRMMRMASCFCLASASGVMAYVSLAEVMGESIENFKHGLAAEEKIKREVNGTVVADCDMHDIGDEVEPKALLFATIIFFVGWIFGLLMDSALHKFMNYREEAIIQDIPLSNGESTDYSGMDEQEKLAQKRFETDKLRLIKVGWFTALALTLHNIPEGLLTYTGAQASDGKTAYGIALAIALHNIPEGFAVAMPIYIAYNSRAKAMLYAGITGFAEPFGAALGWAFFTLTCAETDSPSSLMWFGVMFGITAGIMTEVAIKALLVEAVHYDPNDKICSTAWALGALVIAVSLVAIGFLG